jgi:hypothetical protein
MLSPESHNENFGSGLSQDEIPLVGLKAIAAYATSIGGKTSASTLQKRNSQGKGPELLGYWGKQPTTSRALVREWVRTWTTPTRRAGVGIKPTNQINA